MYEPEVQISVQYRNLVATGNIARGLRLCRRAVLPWAGLKIAALFRWLCHRQTLGDDGIDRRVEGETYMRARHLEVVLAIAGHAVSPVGHSIGTGVDGRFQHRTGQLAAE